MPIPDQVDILEKLDSFLWERDVNPATAVAVNEWPTWLGTAQQLRKARGLFRVQRDRLRWEPAAVKAHALVDVNNDGTPDPVFQDNHGCHEAGIGSAIVVLNSDYTDVDRVITEQILAKPTRPKAGAYFIKLPPGKYGPVVAGRVLDFRAASDGFHSRLYGLLGYKGIVHVTVLERPPYFDLEPKYRLKMSRVENGMSREVCSFLYAQ
jgi:hypothetical protein